MSLPRALTLIALALAISLSIGCQSTAPAPEATTGPATGGAVLRVGVTTQFPPMIFKQGSEITGLEAEAARELGKQLGRPVKFVEVKWDQQIASLLARKTDIVMSSMTITAERRMRAAFSDPYLKGGQMMLIRRTNLNSYSLGIPPLLPGTVGVIQGTVGEYFVQREFSSSKRRAFTDLEEAVAALVAGRIDSLVSDAPVVWYQAGVNESKGLTVVPRMLTNEAFGWAVRPDDAELLKQVNVFLAARQADGSLNGMIKRWVPLAH
jgi:polar amino acid transport system substrate-binding protein